jgi:hypothetical protein
MNLDTTVKGERNMSLTISSNVLEVTGKHQFASLEGRDRAIDRARGYLNLARKSLVQEDRNEFLRKCRKAVKTARTLNHVLVSMRKLESTTAEHAVLTEEEPS